MAANKVISKLLRFKGFRVADWRLEARSNPVSPPLLNTR